MSRWRWAAIAGSLAGAAWLASMALDGYRAILGPLVASVLPIPFAIWATSIAVLDARYRRTSALLGILARMSLLAVALAFVAGPDLTIANQIAVMVAARIGDAADELRKALAALAAIVVAVAVVTSLVGQQQAAPATRRQVGGPNIHPIARTLLRSLARLALLVAGAVSWLAIVTTGWLVLGWWRLRLALAPAADRDQWVRRALARRDRVLARGFVLVGGAWPAVRRSQVHGVWVSPAWLARSEELELLEERAWERTRTPEDAELAELGRGLLAAYDVALQALARGGDPRAPAPRVGPYRLEIARAWSRPEFHAVALSVTPAHAAAVAARVGLDQLVPVLDAVTSWTGEDLRAVRLSDRRIADDPLREGTVGLFISLDRTPATSASADPDPVVAAVDRALGEAGLRGRFRFAAREEGIEADAIEYRASFRTSGEWRELESAWRNLQPAVSLFAKSQAVRLETRLDPYGFIAVVPRPASEFPSGEATDWARVFERYEPVLRRHPLRFVLGLDHRGEPVFVELGNETPHLLVAGGTGSGKSRSAVFSPLLQLLELNPPARLGLWLIDSVKRELATSFGAAPHVRHAVVAEDAHDVVATVEQFAAEMDARYRELQGRAFDPATGQSQLCIVEEFGDLVLLLDRADNDRFVRAVTRIGQLGRAAGFHLVLVTQKASSVVLSPRIKSNFKGRISGYFPNVSDYGIVFDEHRRLLPNVKGRLALTTGSGIVICQGLYADNETIHRRILTMRGTQGLNPRPLLAPWPTQADIDRLDDETLVRLLYAWRSDDRDLTVTVRGLAEQIRSWGLTPGRVERLTDSLALLERAGVLARTSPHATAPRRLAYTSPEEALDRLRIAPSRGRAQGV